MSNKSQSPLPRKKNMNMVDSTIAHKNSLPGYQMGIVICHICKEITWYLIYDNNVADELIKNAMSTRVEYIKFIMHLKFKRYHWLEIACTFATLYRDELGNLYNIEASELYRRLINVLAMTEFAIVGITRDVVEIIDNCPSLWIGNIDVGRPPRLQKIIEIISQLDCQPTTTAVYLFLKEAKKRCREVQQRTEQIKNIMDIFKKNVAKLVEVRSRVYRKECHNILPDIINNIYNQQVWGEIYEGEEEIPGDTVIVRLQRGLVREFNLRHIMPRIRQARPDVVRDSKRSKTTTIRIRKSICK